MNELHGSRCWSFMQVSDQARALYGRQQGGMRAQKKQHKLLAVEAAADRMGTSVRFVRRLIVERRIEFIKPGRLARIAESDIDAFIEAGSVPAITSSDGWRAARRIA